MKRWLVCFLCSSALLAGAEFPTIIDFAKVDPFDELLFQNGKKSWEKKLGAAAYELGYIAFNDAPEIGTFISLLRDEYRIKGVIETGTLYGASALLFAQIFDEVHSIHASPLRHGEFKDLLCRYKNVHFHEGTSTQQVLNELLPQHADKRFLFYLAPEKEGTNYWPLIEELEEISKTHRDNCILIIDDCATPSAPSLNGFQSSKKSEASHEFIQAELKKIFSNYAFHYLIPKNSESPAKFVAIPKKWQDPQYKGRVDVLPGQNFYDLPIDLKKIQDAHFEIRVSNQFFNGEDRGNYTEEISGDADLKKIVVLNNTVDPSYLAKFPKEKLALFLLEPLDLPDAYFEPCSRVYTWNDDQVDGVKFFKLFYPYLRPMLQHIPSFEEKKLCVMVSGSDNAYPERKNELYSERMRMVEFFETKPPGEFEVYGRYWIKRFYRDYRGTIPGDLAGEEKIAILKNYRFCICFENTKELNGYITEKIFGCFAAGCVPVYWGASNIEKYIPKSCFIDYRDFASREQLYQFIKNMPKEVYERYIESIRTFLKSDRAQVFSPEYFGELLFEAIKSSSR